jgi:glycosyltransferase involved in cell wall biosynthesis
VSDRLGPVEAVGVVVPAHDEETLLPACLAALRDAASALRLPVHVVVVADACTDQTAADRLALGIILLAADRAAVAVQPWRPRLIVSRWRRCGVAWSLRRCRW